jgi:ComF family protein
VDCRAGLRWLRPGTLRVAGVEAFAPLAYEGSARELVRALKYRGARALVSTMAAQIAANAPPELLGKAAALVPVPLHRARLRRRGFNQAELLAADLGARTGLSVDACLERRGRAAEQVGRGRAARMAGPGDVRLRPRARAPRSVLLVDDVVTTGATVAACAAALRAGGSRNVRALAYARTLAR